MPYILTKTNGTTLATINDASVDLTTNLTFVGRNYSGYGQIIDENFVKLLENFANTTQPTKPLQGQLWFNTANQTLNYCHDGSTFKPIASISVQSTTPNTPSRGDLWWDTTTAQLKAFDGSTYLIVGPQTSEAAKATWASVEDISAGDTSNVVHTLYEGKVGPDVVAVLTNLSADYTDFNPSNNIDLNTNFTVIKNGITLLGSDATGSSKNAGYYFWGTAAESLTADTANGLQTTSVGDNAEYLVPFISTSDNSAHTTSTFHFNPSINVLTVTATAAQYADLAENYLADQEYEVGTVLTVGGEREVTACKEGDRVIGVVSANPAYLMNTGLSGGTPVALKGRVTVKTYGNIKKGDRLVSTNNGRAKPSVFGHPEVFAIALSDSFHWADREESTVEAVIL